MANSKTKIKILVKKASKLHSNGFFFSGDNSITIKTIYLISEVTQKKQFRQAATISKTN